MYLYLSTSTVWKFFFCCFFFLLPFIALFSPSSDIQGVGEGHPPACLTNYKYGVLMVGTHAHFFRSSIMHFEGNNETAVHNHEGAFFIAFLFSDGFCTCLIVDPCYDLKKL